MRENKIPFRLSALSVAHARPVCTRVHRCIGRWEMQIYTVTSQQESWMVVRPCGWNAKCAESAQESYNHRINRRKSTLYYYYYHHVLQLSDADCCNTVTLFLVNDNLAFFRRCIITFSAETITMKIRAYSYFLRDITKWFLFLSHVL